MYMYSIDIDHDPCENDPVLKAFHEEILFLRRHVIELTEEDERLAHKLKKARKEKKRLKRKYLMLKNSL